MIADLFVSQKSKNLLQFLSISESEYYCWSSVTQRTVACQAPLSLGFTREEYRTGLPCHPPGDLSSQPRVLTGPPGKPLKLL